MHTTNIHFTDIINILTNVKYYIIGFLFVVLIVLEVLYVRINQCMLKIAYVKLMYVDNFTHYISTWEIKYLPIIASIFGFPIASIVGYYSSFILNGIYKHFFSIDIIPYLKIDFTKTVSPLKLIILGFLFLFVLFITEIDNNTPLIRKLIETIRTSMKEMISEKMEEVPGDSTSLFKKVDILISKFHKLLGLEEKITLRGRLDEYYEKLLFSDAMYPELRKLYYGKGAAFIVAFLLGTNTNVWLFLAVIPAYLVALLYRILAFQRINDLYILYYDFAKDISKSSNGVKSKLFAIVPDEGN